ncbi:MAG: polysaccharide deacetylase family protein [Nitrospira sp.]|nr:polysaccharide deacetylase family protein [Nitrospira sp.]
MIRPFCVILTGLLAISSLSGTLPAQAQVIRSGSPHCPGVALTFDLCPVKNGSGIDEALLDYLITHRIPSTLFLSGKWITQHEEAVSRLMKPEWFEIGTHGQTHAHLPLYDAQKQRTEIWGPVAHLKAHHARQATLFRPPYGEFDDVTVQVVKALGLRFIQWDIASGDPDPHLSAEQILNHVTGRLKPGSIVVFHANGKGKHTRDVIERLTRDVLPRRHLTPMTVSELLNCKGEAP